MPKKKKRKEIDTFLEIYNVQRLKSGIPNQNTPIISRDWIKWSKLPIQKIPVLDVFTGEFYQTFRGLNTNPQTLPKYWGGKHLKTHPMKPALHGQWDGVRIQESYRPTPLMTTEAKILNRSANQIQHIKRLYIMTKCNLTLGVKKYSTYANQ